MPSVNEERFYRRWVTAEDLVGFEVCVDETDLAILAEVDLSELALAAVERLRGELLAYIGRHREFLSSLKPVEAAPDAPLIVRRMAQAGSKFGVGPMAAVAGAIAEVVGRELLEHSSQVSVENGGDIFIKMNAPRRVTLYAGPGSPFSKKLGLMLDSSDAPVAVCTSSGTVGHSLSFGRADAVVAIADSAASADAAATAIANTIREPHDIQPALDRQTQRGELRGLLIAMGDKLGAWGEIQLA